MAATIKIKNSSTASAVPTSSDLVQGELAVNVTDKRIFTENASGTVVELGTNPSILTLPDGSASAPTLTNDGDTNTGLFFPAADTVGISTGGTERARVDSSGNLGIGTSSPSYRLDAQGTVTDANVARIKPLAGSSSTTVVLDVQAGDSSTLFKVLNSGNAGLGVTPSAWGSDWKAVQVGARSFYGQNGGTSTRMGYNWYQNSGGTNTYIGSDYATGYLMDSAHKWLIAGSGTAGGTVSFTQAMTLDASGNLGIGTTSPNQGGGTRAITLNAPAGGNYSGYEIMTAGTLRGKWLGNDITTYFGTVTATPLAFITTDIERARIDSSGNLLVGGTSTNESFSGVPSIQGVANCIFTNKRSSTSSSSQFRFYNPNGLVGQIETSGSSTSYATSSDYRLKENIAPMTGALATVAQLKPCTYTWKADGSEGQGFIAHELQAVLPDAVSGEKDAVNEDGSIKPQGIDTSFLVATLTAAIKEQQQIITALTARIEALEQA